MPFPLTFHCVIFHLDPFSIVSFWLKFWELQKWSMYSTVCQKREINNLCLFYGQSETQLITRAMKK